MTTPEAITNYLNKTVEALKSDASEKKQKIPVASFRIEVTEEGGKLWAADYFKYLILGRGPGKQPPPDSMTDYVNKNPDKLAEAKKIWKNITAAGLGYIIGRSIAQKGTLIYQGKKPGIDLLGSMEQNMPELLKTLATNEAAKFITSLKSNLR